MNKHRGSYIIFSLSLFILFVVGSFFVITYEVKGYQLINTTISQSDDLTVPLAYLNSKLKGNNNDVSLIRFNGIDSLLLQGNDTKTYIYFYNDYLCELYVSANYDGQLDDGDKLFKLDDFKMSEDNNLFNFEVIKDKESKSLSLYVHGSEAVR